jgi:hypothetical protein
MTSIDLDMGEPGEPRLYSSFAGKAWQKECPEPVWNAMHINARELTKAETQAALESIGQTVNKKDKSQKLAQQYSNYLHEKEKEIKDDEASKLLPGAGALSDGTPGNPKTTTENPETPENPTVPPSTNRPVPPLTRVPRDQIIRSIESGSEEDDFVDHDNDDDYDFPAVSMAVQVFKRPLNVQRTYIGWQVYKLKTWVVIMYGKRSHALYRYEDPDSNQDLNCEMDFAHNLNKKPKFGSGRRWNKTHIISITAVLFHNPEPGTDFTQQALERLDPVKVNAAKDRKRQENAVAGNSKAPIRGIRAEGKAMVKYQDERKPDDPEMREWVGFSILRGMYGQDAGDNHIWNTAQVTYRRFDQATKGSSRGYSRSPTVGLSGRGINIPKYYPSPPPNRNRVPAVEVDDSE